MAEQQGISLQHQGDFGGNKRSMGDLLLTSGASVSAPVFNLGSGNNAPPTQGPTMPVWGWWALGGLAVAALLRFIRG